MGGGLVQGSVNREILNTAFGEALITSIAAYNNQRAVNSLLRSDSDGEDEEEGQHVDDGGLVGTDRTAGKLQVVVSGPREFVVHVGQLLAEMGVPSGCMVLLD
ncbi:unnamed protein product [Ectocarpus sp. 13 AM-2016]